MYPYRARLMGPTSDADPGKMQQHKWYDLKGTGKCTDFCSSNHNYGTNMPGHKNQTDDFCFTKEGSLTKPAGITGFGNTTGGNFHASNGSLSCDMAVPSVNGANFPSGCAGAVWSNGLYASRYCNGDRNKSGDNLFPWYKKCCKEGLGVAHGKPACVPKLKEESAALTNKLPYRVCSTKGEELINADGSLKDVGCGTALLKSSGERFGCSIKGSNNCAKQCEDQTQCVGFTDEGDLCRTLVHRTGRKAWAKTYGPRLPGDGDLRSVQETDDRVLGTGQYIEIHRNNTNISIGGIAVFDENGKQVPVTHARPSIREGHKSKGWGSSLGNDRRDGNWRAANACSIYRMDISTIDYAHDNYGSGEDRGRCPNAANGMRFGCLPYNQGGTHDASCGGLKPSLWPNGREHGNVTTDRPPNTRNGGDGRLTKFFRYGMGGYTPCPNDGRCAWGNYGGRNGLGNCKYGIGEARKRGIPCGEDLDSPESLILKGNEDGSYEGAHLHRMDGNQRVTMEFKLARNTKIGRIVVRTRNNGSQLTDAGDPKITIRDDRHKRRWEASIRKLPNVHDNPRWYTFTSDSLPHGGAGVDESGASKGLGGMQPGRGNYLNPGPHTGDGSVLATSGAPLDNDCRWSSGQSDNSTWNGGCGWVGYRGCNAFSGRGLQYAQKCCNNCNSRHVDLWSNGPQVDGAQIYAAERTMQFADCPTGYHKKQQSTGHGSPELLCTKSTGNCAIYGKADLPRCAGLSGFKSNWDKLVIRTMEECRERAEQMGAYFGGTTTVPSDGSQLSRGNPLSIPPRGCFLTNFQGKRGVYWGGETFVRGRKIRLQQPLDYVNLEALIVYDKNGDRIKFGSSQVKMSSLHSSPYSTDKILETGTGMVHTKNGKNEYIEVTLDKEYDIGRIEVHNRRDCCQNRWHDYGSVRVLDNGGKTTFIQRADQSSEHSNGQTRYSFIYSDGYQRPHLYRQVPVGSMQHSSRGGGVAVPLSPGEGVEDYEKSSSDTCDRS